MDLHGEKLRHQQMLVNNFPTENNNTKNTQLSSKILPNPDNKEDFSKRLLTNQDLAYDSVDKIIEKYKDGNVNKNNYEHNSINLSNTAEYSFLRKNVEFAHSVQNFNLNYINHKHMANFNNIGYSLTNACDAIFYNQKLDSTPKVLFKDYNNLIDKKSEWTLESGLTSNQTLYADKMTYCRPVLSLYNEQFIYKTMRRNCRLKKLVKKFAIARQKEKENINWNNFINELKNKHGFNCYESKRTLQSQREPELYVTPDIIDDYHDTRFSCQQSRLCKNLLQDVYDASQPTCSHRRRSCESTKSHSNRSFFPHHRDSFCYPTSSQGRLILIERERQKNEYLDKWNNRFNNNNIKPGNHYANKKNIAIKFVQNLQEPYSLTNEKYGSANCYNSKVQTERIMFADFKEDFCRNKATNKIGIINKDEVVQTIGNIKNITDQNPIDENDMNSLRNIEIKLETLVNFINNFVDEIKLNRKSNRENKYVSVSCEINNSINRKTDKTKSDIENPVGIAISEKLICGLSNASSENAIIVSKFRPLHKPSKIMEINEMNSERKIFKSQPCSVEITFEVPTKDCSTEVTKSLSKQDLEHKMEIIKGINTPHMPLQHMTIAVNTDPLSFLTILRISTEILKGFLSYMPNIDYHSYLPMRILCQSSRKMESQYTCNVCGAAFDKLSKLCDHIQEHSLGKTRDCCVCRHVIDMCKRYPGLFRCKFCGQRFTRAYCCELHQQSCARRLGQKHDVSSSLMLLR